MEPYAAADAAATLARLTGRDVHDVAVVLGSGWSPAVVHGVRTAVAAGCRYVMLTPGTVVLPFYGKHRIAVHYRLTAHPSDVRFLRSPPALTTLTSIGRGSVDRIGL